MRLHAIVSDLETAETAIAGGATVVQLRCKDAPTQELVQLGVPVRQLCHERGVTFVVDDDVEAALELHADGVHLGHHGRGGGLALRHGLLIGMTACHVDDAVAAERAEAAYLGAGPVWGDDAIGLEGLAAIAAAVSVPVVAFGGVDASNAADCIRAGARGVAVRRLAADPAAVRAALDAAL